MSWQWELVHHHEFITEGPVWDGRYLFYSEIYASRTWRYDPDSGERVVWREDTGRANGMLRAPGGGLLACEGGGRRVVRYVAEADTEVIADRFEGKQFNEPNDLAQAAGGRIWFSDPNYGGRPMQLNHESVYCVDPGVSTGVDPGGPPRRVTFDTNRPNGVLLNEDESELYVAESPHRPDQRRQLRAYPIAADGSLGEHRVLHDFADARGVDGMTRTTEGLIVATAGHRERGPGPMIYVFEPSGRVVSTHPSPADRPTNCTFAEAGRGVLYVTFAGGELYRVSDTGLSGAI
ncbi:MAG: SMP-30/gluconolactonase/LRE family protein [Spirochaetaceae bacterium]|nr:SMP-30/gluconolactonase/LRE family protein [Spirochaetaceae bacterium]